MRRCHEGQLGSCPETLPRAGTGYLRPATSERKEGCCPGVGQAKRRRGAIGWGCHSGSNNLDSSQLDVAVGEFVGLVAEDSTLQKQSIFLCPSIPTRRSGLQERRRWLLLAVSGRQSVDRVQGIARARGGSPCQRAGIQLQVTDQPWALYTKQSSMMDGIRDLPTGAQARGQDCVIWNGLCCS